MFFIKTKNLKTKCTTISLLVNAHYCVLSLWFVKTNSDLYFSMFVFELNPTQYFLNICTDIQCRFTNPNQLTKPKEIISNDGWKTKIPSARCYCLQLGGLLFLFIYLFMLKDLCIYYLVNFNPLHKYLPDDLYVIKLL